MKILTHISRTADEIVNIIEQTGSFTAPMGLPHWRYASTKRNVYELEKAKVVRRIGKNDIHVHLGKGANFEAAISSGVKALVFCDAIKKQYKLDNPPQPKKKVCIGCGSEFLTLNPKKKRCVNACGKDYKKEITQ